MELIAQGAANIITPLFGGNIFKDNLLIAIGAKVEKGDGVVRVSKWITKNECRMEEGGSPIGFYLSPEKYSKLEEGDEDKKKYDSNPWNYPADVPIPNYINTFNPPNQQPQGDDQEDDDQGDDEDQYYKSLRKSRPDTKYLKVTLD